MLFLCEKAYDLILIKLMTICDYWGMVVRSANSTVNHATVSLRLRGKQVLNNLKVCMMHKMDQKVVILV